MIATAPQIDAAAVPAGNESSRTIHNPAALSLPSGDASDSSAVVATRVRQCPRCRVWVPAGCFRLHTRKDGNEHRLSICDECRWQAERVRRENVARTKQRKAFHKTWSDLARSKNQRRAVASIVGRLWDSMGGSSGIARGWADALKAGSAAQRIRSYEGFVRLTEWLAENPETLTDVALLSDAELAAETANARAVAFVELLQSDPATAADLARRCGFSLEPLPNSIDKTIAVTHEAVQ